MATTANRVKSLTEVEQTLVEHVERGEILDLAGDEPTDQAAMRTWGDTRTVSATVVRDIMRGRLVADPDPHGLRLRGARIHGRLDLENITSTIWLELWGCLLEDGINVRDAHLQGVLLNDCWIAHPTEPAIDANRLTATSLSLNRTIGDAHSSRGTVNLHSARLDGLFCSGTRLSNDSGPGLNAARVQVDRDVVLNAGFQSIGAGKRGAVRLLGAHLGGLSCSGARLVNDSGPALHADDLRVDGDVDLQDEFEASGSGDLGAVRLLGAHLGGQLDMSRARLVNDSGPALSAERLRVDKRLILSHGFTARGAGGGVVLNLEATAIGGFLSFQPERLEHLTNPHARLWVDGLTYLGLPHTIRYEDWMALLRDGTPEYAAQPYQHLAAAHRAAGHDREARRVLIVQRRDQITRALTGRTERTWAHFTGLLLGYGYKPWRALIALTAVITTAVLTSVILGSHGALAQTRTTPPNAVTATAPTPAPCTWIEHIGVGLDLGTPLLTTNTRTRCDTTNTTPGHILTITGWLLRLLAWAFATSSSPASPQQSAKRDPRCRPHDHRQTNHRFRTTRRNM